MFEVDFDFDGMEILVERRKAVSKMKPICSECGSEQIQITNWYNQICDMRCRRCKHKFVIDSGI